MHTARLSLCRYHSRWSFVLPAPGRAALAAASGRPSRQRPLRLALLATVPYSGAARLHFFLAAGAFPLIFLHQIILQTYSLRKSLSRKKRCFHPFTVFRTDYFQPVWGI